MALRQALPGCGAATKSDAPAKKRPEQNQPTILPAFWHQRPWEDIASLPQRAILSHYVDELCLRMALSSTFKGAVLPLVARPAKAAQDNFKQCKYSCLHNFGHLPKYSNDRSGWMYVCLYPPPRLQRRGNKPACPQGPWQSAMKHLLSSAWNNQMSKPVVAQTALHPCAHLERSFVLGAVTRQVWQWVLRSQVTSQLCARLEVNDRVFLQPPA